LLHAELIAINGNPDLYARQGNVPSSDRSETAATLKLEGTGTEYAAWVPVNTRTQTRLTPGIWYLAVKAAGTTNARYRLRLAHGNPLAGGLVQDLPLTGGNLTGQLLAAGDLRFYRVAVPVDAPASWLITYSQTQGDVDLFVRDSAPPGISGTSYSATSYYDYVSDWRSDSKNQGPYNYYPNQGATTLTTPPLRPGNIYYLGFYANTDASFSVGSATTGTVAQPVAIAFYGGSLSNVSVPAGGSVTYRIEVPADATRWKSSATHAASMNLFIEEGTSVDLTRLAAVAPHAQSSATANWTFNHSLVGTNSWPWQPGVRMFYLTAQNSAASDQAFGFQMNGKNALTEDEDGDGLPDAWELTFFSSIYSYDGTSDPDADGSTNLQEYQNGTNPMSAASVKFQLVLTGVGASVAADPAPGPYLPNANVTLSASPNSGLTFLGWAPTAYNASTGYAAAAAAATAATTLALTMDANKRYTAYAGVPLADALDGGGLGWTTGGSALWFGQTTTTWDGIDAAQAAGLQNYNDEAWVRTAVTAPGTVAWRWKLNEVTNGNSRIEFAVDSSNVVTLSSTADWTQQSYAVTGTGQKTLRWRMVRETSNAAASGDAAFLDTVSYVPWVAPAVQPASNIAYTAFTANWSAVTGASGYYLDIATSADFTSGFVVTNSSVGNVVSYNASGLQAGTAYYYRVRVSGAPGTSASSATVTVTTTSFPAPVAQAASGVGQNGFTANWSTVAAATSYRLDVASTADFSGGLVVNNTSLATTSYAVTGLLPGTNYYYRVRAVGAATSGNSNIMSVTTVAFGPPVALSAVNITSSGFTANWAALAGATSYTLDVATVADFSSGVATFAAISATSYNVTGRLSGTTYYYRVRATGAPGTSGNSNVITVVTPGSAPMIGTPPLSGFITAGQSVTLTVVAGGGNLTYQWYRGTSGNTGSPLSGATTASFTTPALTQTTSYWVRVSNGLGSINSATATLKLMPPSLTLAAWGADASSQTKLPSGTTGLVMVAGGDSHTLALKLDGTVLAWGDNTSGQATVPTGLTGVTAIAAGGAHSLALKSDGTVVGWGYNGNGQTTIPTGLGGVVAIAAGPNGNHSLALKADGTVAAWGRNDYGQTTVPAGLTGVVAITAGYNFSLALKSDGTVIGWGSNGYGQTTIPTGLGGVVAISAGAYHSLALKSDGTVVAWGDSASGKTTVPTGLSGVVAIVAGANHSLALKADGTVAAWGSNASGQTTVPAGLTGVVAIAAGANHSLVLFEGLSPVLKLVGGGTSSYDLTLSASAAWTVNETLDWVSVTPATGNGNGAVSVGVAANNSAQPRFGTFAVAGRTAIVYQAGAPANNGTLAAWGDNSSLQTSVATGLTGLVKVAGGDSHTLALKLDGTVLAWGGNSSGQATVPTGLIGVTAIAAGGTHSLALKADGTVVGWGYNGYGQTTVLAGLTGVVAITAGSNFSLALKSDGTVIGWGSNGYGQTTIPTGLGGVVAIAAGASHSLALKTDGTVVAWGYNTSGQTSVPTGLTGVVAIAAGASHSLALKADGTVVAWGSNGYGQTTIPTGLIGVVAIAAGASHSLALKGDPFVAPVITTQPLDVAVTVTSYATFTVAAAGTAPFSYQWQVSTDAGSSWSNLTNAGDYAGVDLTDLTVTTRAGLNGCQYRCVVSNSVGPAISGAATLTDSEPFAAALWRQFYFGNPSNSGNGTDTATPDHDGIPNLVKYGLVITPCTSGVDSLPIAQTRSYAEGTRLALIFTRDPARNDITLQVQGANSPAGPWTNLATSANGAAFTGVGLVSEINAAGNLKTVEIRDTINMSAAPHRFMRIEVTH